MIASEARRRSEFDLMSIACGNLFRKKPLDPFKRQPQEDLPPLPAKAVMGMLAGIGKR